MIMFLARLFLSNRTEFIFISPIPYNDIQPIKKKAV